jgi:serine/threonine protein kinase
MENEISGKDEPREPLRLEDYVYTDWLGSTPLTHLRLYLDCESGERVIVEEIRPEITTRPDFDQAFHERISGYSEVEHPGLIRLLGYGRTENGGYYIVREHVEGLTLREHFDTYGMDQNEVLHFIIAIADALDALEKVGVIHGSVASSNVWITHDLQVKIEIFPVNSLFSPNHLVSLLGLEVIHGLAPERISGAEASTRGDIFSLGALYYELITGNLPKGVITPQPFRETVDVRCWKVMLQALSTQPDQRQVDFAAFLAPIERVASGGNHLFGEGVPDEQTPLHSSKARIEFIPTILVCGMIFAVASLSWHLMGRNSRANSQIEAAKTQQLLIIKDGNIVDPIDVVNPFDVVAAEATEGPQMTIGITPSLRWNETLEIERGHELHFVLDNAEEIRKIIIFDGETDHDAGAEDHGASRYHFEGPRGTLMGQSAAFRNDGEFPVFKLILEHGVDHPPRVALALSKLRDAPSLISNFVPLDDDVLPRHIAQATTTSEDIDDGQKTPHVPTPSPFGADAYIYAAHFFYGEEIGLLKLQFGNAGRGMMDCASLLFQCAFSNDTEWGPLVPARAGHMPVDGNIVAAGGFTAKWLEANNLLLMPGRKIWTKHTFRIDTSDPDIRENAKYLLVKISPDYSITESNYRNNVVAIPLDYPDEWHSVTQDPADLVTPGDDND